MVLNVDFSVTILPQFIYVVAANQIIRRESKSVNEFTECEGKSLNFTISGRHSNHTVKVGRTPVFTVTDADFLEERSFRAESRGANVR